MHGCHAFLVSCAFPSHSELHDNHFEGVFPSCITNLKNIEFMNLSRNQITELPYQFGDLTTLTTLKVGPSQSCTR